MGDAESDRVTVSVGVASAEPPAFDETALVRQADEALYRAKSAGRNRVVSGPVVLSAGAAQAIADAMSRRS